MGLARRAEARKAPRAQVALVVKNPPANAGDLRDAGSIPPLEEEMATHFSTLVWRIPRTEEPTVHRVAESQTH